MFCPKCGTKQENENAKFCIGCGAPLYAQDIDLDADDGAQSQSFQEAAGSLYKSVSDRIKNVTGDDGSSRLRVSDLFTNVPKRHTRDERDRIFICGTKDTTPPENAMTRGWQKPFVYSRIFLFFTIAFLLLWFMVAQFKNANAVPGLIIMGSFAGPVAVMFLFFEMNVPRDISFFDSLTVFFIGGCMSLMAALILFEVTGWGTKLDFLGSFAVGIIEEIAKIVIVAVFMFIALREKKPKFILGGLLLGAAVGAGFGAFESAGYAYRYYVGTGSVDQLIKIIFMRGFLSPGMHVAWAAIEGGALMLGAEGRGFSWDIFKKPRVIILFVIPIVLHALWDWGDFLGEFMNGYFKAIMLLIIAWIFLIHLIKAGLSQVERVERGGPLI